jgi:hypothetical protein
MNLDAELPSAAYKLKFLVRVTSQIRSERVKHQTLPVIARSVRMCQILTI